MTRVFPYPRLSIALFALWLMLNQSVAARHILMAALVAIIGPIIATALELPSARLRRPQAALALLGRVIFDIVRSNIAVAKIILDPAPRNRVSGFLNVPLELRDLNGLAILACIVTATPGTIWVSFDRANGILQIHVLDLVDKESWVRIIKQRYERLLLEIFE
ncbi:Na+/H+ antiporter subunit E [Rhodoligotrophos ferricapiens]|uniref:Na+/H+ antiporter subunit E n=1 Tax=Rhodoligotrophos ferricapiens TaxID=3069264 RepID=UPI00315D9F6D